MQAGSVDLQRRAHQFDLLQPPVRGHRGSAWDVFEGTIDEGYECGLFGFEAKIEQLVDHPRPTGDFAIRFVAEGLEEDFQMLRHARYNSTGQRIGPITGGTTGLTRSSRMTT